MPDIIIYFLLAVLALQAILHARERKDLYNRLMARDLKDYAASKSREPPKSRNFVRKGLERGYGMVEEVDK